MIDIFSKHDKMHKNGIFYALFCNNNHIISCINCMLSRGRKREGGHKRACRLVGGTQAGEGASMGGRRN